MWFNMPPSLLIECSLRKKLVFEKCCQNMTVEQPAKAAISWKRATEVFVCLLGALCRQDGQNGLPGGPGLASKSRPTQCSNVCHGTKYKPDSAAPLAFSQWQWTSACPGPVLGLFSTYPQRGDCNWTWQLTELVGFYSFILPSEPGALHSATVNANIGNKHVKQWCKQVIQ